MKVQISDSVPCGILLALSGGSMDAYSYLFRGGVFANAQTGNLLLFGVHLSTGNLSEAFKYLWPVLAFTLGIILSDVICHQKEFLRIHWRQISVFIEAVLFLVVAFLSRENNAVANAIISFACGMQVESFRKIHGNSIATTMCIGNLRSGTYYLDKYLTTRDRTFLRKAGLYFGIILSFVIGAVVESWLISRINGYAILFSTGLLAAALVLMFRKEFGEDGDTYMEG